MNDFLPPKVYEKIRSVLEQDPANRPRAVLQTYNAFLHRWAIVKLLGNENYFNPSLLALLLLLQYAWPEMFYLISVNPYHFYYLHALATGKPNKVCGQTEIDEFHDIKFPSKVWNSQLALCQEKKMIPALNSWEFSEESRTDFYRGHSPLSIMSQYITLDPATLNSRPIFQEMEIWKGIKSGDPAQIKLVAFYEGEKIITTIFEQPLREPLLDLNKEFQKGGLGISETLDDADANIFALGLIGNTKETIDTLYDILRNSPPLPTHLRLRCIYALERLISKRKDLDEGDHEKISLLINEILFSDKEQREQGHRVRVRVARLIRYESLSNSELKLVVESLYRKDESIDVQRAFLESWQVAIWREKALNQLTEEQLNNISPIQLLMICEGGSWPALLMPYFVKIAHSNNEALALRAFTLLLGFSTSPDKRQSSEDKQLVMQWLSEVLPKNEDLREKCWIQVSELQKDNTIPWQDVVWRQLVKFALSKGDIRIVHAIVNTKRVEALTYHEKLLTDSPVDWKNAIEDAFEKLREQVSLGKKNVEAVS